MIKKIYLNKRIPWVSISYIIASIIITLAVFYNNDLYYVFAGTKSKYYFWQYFTLLFNHGSYQINTFAHLFVNLALASFFGIYIEKLLSKKILIIFLFGSLIVFYLGFYLLNDLYGNGASGILYSLSSLTLAIVWFHKKETIFKKNLFYYIFLVLIIFTWIVIPIGDYYVYKIITSNTLLHFLGITYGIIFFIIYKERILCELKTRLNNNNDKKIKKPSKLLFVILTILLMSIFLIIALNNQGLLTNHRSKVEVIDIEKNYIADPPHIIISFSGPIKKQVKERSFYKTNEGDMNEELKVLLEWVSNTELHIVFNRKPSNTDTFKLYLKGLTDLQGKLLLEDIFVKH